MAVFKPKLFSTTSYKHHNWDADTKFQRHKKAIVMYTSIVDQLDYKSIMQECQMPDTFNSWFKVVELHIWMMLLRLYNENHPNAKQCGHDMVKNLWTDTTAKAKKLGKMNINDRKKGIQLLDTQFRAAILNYDEGIAVDDCTLAGAVWRSLLQTKCDDPVIIEHMVHYIRKQVHHLSMVEITQLGFVPLLPFRGEFSEERTLAFYDKMVETFCSSNFTKDYHGLVYRKHTNTVNNDYAAGVVTK